MRDVAACLKITSPGTTLVVDRLVENKELDRQTDKEDRRIVRLGITAKGQATLERGMKVVRAKISARMNVLNQTQKKELETILAKLINHNQ